MRNGSASSLWRASRSCASSSRTRRRPGLRYEPEPPGDGPIASFPGKAARLLHERWRTFQGDPRRGLILLPCELTERNGDALRDAVLRHAADWGWPEAFREWVRQHNRFLNTLVDRIVTGYPDAEQAESWFAEWGYRDAMLTTAEPYHLWASRRRAGARR